MFTNTDKRRLYWLINEYLEDRMDTWTFSGEYVTCFSVDVELETLSELERTVFSTLNVVAARFSKFESDFREFPGVFFTEGEVKAQAIETKRCLKKYFEEFEFTNE